MPVGPDILWPEKARKSQPSAWTSSGRWPALCAASTTVMAPMPARAGAQFGDGVDRAERVRDVGEREELHVARRAGRRAGEVQQALVARHGDEAQLRAGALREQLPRHEVAVVLHLGEQDDIAPLEARGAPA